MVYLDYVTSQSASTDPVQVYPGQTLVSTIDMIVASSGEYQYAAAFNLPDSTITVTRDLPLDWPVMVIEQYGVEEASQFPSGTTVMQDVNLRSLDGVPNMNWGPQSGEGITTTVETDGATNAKVAFQWPQ